MERKLKGRTDAYIMQDIKKDEEDSKMKIKSRGSKMMARINKKYWSEW
jgi:hypothetical protein